MLKKSVISLLLLFVALGAWAEGRAKYVFYFIGDGMGVNQVNGTETYLAALEGRIGIVPLCFTQFPYSAFVTTYSGTNGVTDSAASGTALATGHKTKNGALGVLADLTTPVTSVAAWAKQAGAADHQRERGSRHAGGFLCTPGRTRLLLRHRTGLAEGGLRLLCRL